MKKYKNEIAVGVFILVAAVLLGYMSITIGKVKLDQGVRVTAVFNNASGVVKDSAVMIAGVDVGSVEKLGIDHDKALFTLYLKKDAHVKKDVKAAIRAKSLLGEKYVELIPVSKDAPLLQDGDVISNTTTPIEIDQLITKMAPLLAKVDSDKLGKLINTIASSVNGREKEFGAIISGAARVMSSVDNTQVAKIINNLDKLTTSSENLIAQSKGSITKILNNVDKISSYVENSTPRIGKNIENITDKISKASNSADGLVNDANRISKNVINITDNVNKKTPGILNNVDTSMAKLPALLDSAHSLGQKMSPFLDKTLPLLDKAGPLLDKSSPLIDDFAALAKKINALSDADLKALIEGGKIKVKLF